MATFGRALYWLTTLTAALLCAFGVLALNSSDSILKPPVFGSAIIIYLVGRIFRHVTAEKEPPRDYGPKNELHHQSAQQDNVPTEKIIIYTSKEKMILCLLVLMTIAVFMVFIFFDGSVVKDNLFDKFKHWFSIAMCMFFSMICLIRIVRSVPKIILDHERITVIGTFTHRSQKWSDIGPFFLEPKYVYLKIFYFASAFTNEQNDFSVAHNQAQASSDRTANFIIALNEFPPGRNESTALEFIDALNVWREKYGQHEINVYEAVHNEQRQALKKIRIHNNMYRLFYFILILALVILAIYFGGK